MLMLARNVDDPLVEPDDVVGEAALPVPELEAGPLLRAPAEAVGVAEPPNCMVVLPPKMVVPPVMGTRLAGEMDEIWDHRAQ